MAARDREAVRRHVAARDSASRVASAACRTALTAATKAGPDSRAAGRDSAAADARDTSDARRREIAIRLPAVALQHAGIVEPDHRRGLREAAAGLNRIDGRLRA